MHCKQRKLPQAEPLKLKRSQTSKFWEFFWFYDSETPVEGK
jgi:hypothetical protein